MTDKREMVDRTPRRHVTFEVIGLSEVEKKLAATNKAIKEAVQAEIARMGLPPEYFWNRP